MVPPLMKLAFVQGPRDGDSLQYKPGSTIRIGRIVRGNDIAIKDAGISTKHLRIVSDSENWILHDLGSSNGTILNSETVDPDTPVNLSHGDLIKLGECTTIVVNFEIDAPPPEDKLPPRPRRNNRRMAVADPDPVPDPVEEKPKRKGRSSKQEEKLEPPRRTRATRSRTLEDVYDNEEVGNEKEVKRRVGKRRKNEKKVEITKEEEEVQVEKKGNSIAQRGKNSEIVQDLGSNPIKLEVEDTPMGAEIPVVKRATRSKKTGNGGLRLEKLKSEDTTLEEEDEKRASRAATRNKKKEIGGDCFQELEMVLNQARKSRTKKKKTEQIASKKVEIEPENDDVEEDKDNEEAQEGCSERNDKEDETFKMVEQEEIELNNSSLGDKDLNCNVREISERSNKENETSKTVEQEGTEFKKSKAGEEDLNCNVREDSERSDKEDEISKMVVQEEIELNTSAIGEEDLSCSIREDKETENLHDTIDEERDNKRKEAETERSDGGCDEQKAEQVSSNKNVVENNKVEVDLAKMTLGEWFDYMEIQLRKQIVEETEKMIEPMRSRAHRVNQYIAEQKQAKGKGHES